MKALVLKEYKQFAYEDMPDPKPQPDEVIVAVKACGICGSDVHGMDGSTGRRRPPIVMGHEAAGVIAEVGSAVVGWKLGDRVTFDSTIYCGRCDYCRAGQIHLCNQRRVLGVSCEEYRQHGAFADYVAVPERVLYRLPEGLPFEHAAMVEPFSIALHAIRRTPPQLNDTVVVIGAGMIGLALVQALKHTGCGRLIVMDVAPDRLDAALRFGATHAINSGSLDGVAEVLKITSGLGADVSYEAVGLASTVQISVRCLRKGGAVTLVGNLAPDVIFPLQAVVTREITVRGSCACNGEYPACLDMLARGDLDPRPLITTLAPLCDGADWFHRLHRRQPGLLKVVLQPGS